MTDEVAVREETRVVNIEDYAMKAEQLVAQVQMIQGVMKAVMKKDEHYGVIPGCGDKPTLLKPGAEKLATTFRLAPKYSVGITEMGNGHRDYQIKCTLIHIPTGTFVGEGVGGCSTLENKYRFRWDNTGRGVPKEYWETRDSSILGGPQYAVRKVGKAWLVFQKIEHDNPSDYYNTCLKMGKKRALVDAVITCTAASDIFTQDLEDMPKAASNQKTKAKTGEPKKPFDEMVESPPHTEDDIPFEESPPITERAEIDEQNPIVKNVHETCVATIRRAIKDNGLDEVDVKNFLNNTKTFRDKLGEVFGNASFGATSTPVVQEIAEKIDTWMPLAVKSIRSGSQSKVASGGKGK